MVYKVRVKRVGFLGRTKTIKNVIGDGLLENGLSRYFILNDERRIEIPVENHCFEFSKERFESIKKRAEEDAGQPILLKKR